MGDIELAIPYSKPAVQCSLSLVSFFSLVSHIFYFLPIVHIPPYLVQLVHTPTYDDSSLYEDTFTAIALHHCFFHYFGFWELQNTLHIGIIIQKVSISIKMAFYNGNSIQILTPILLLPLSQTMVNHHK